MCFTQIKLKILVIVGGWVVVLFSVCSCLKTNIDSISGKLKEDKGRIEHVYYCHTLGRSLQDYCRRVAGMFG